MGFLEKMFGRMPASPEKISKKINLERFFGSQIPAEQQEELLKKIKEYPEKFEAAEYGGVELLEAATDEVENGEKKFYFIRAKPKSSDAKELVGDTIIEIYPEEKRIFFEAIEIFQGGQPKEISRGDFQRQGMGQRSMLALITMLNEKGMEGWEISAIATNREFTGKLFDLLFGAREMPGGWDEFRGRVPTLEQAKKILEEAKKKTG